MKKLLFAVFLVAVLAVPMTVMSAPNQQQPQQPPQPLGIYYRSHTTLCWVTVAVGEVKAWGTFNVRSGIIIWIDPHYIGFVYPGFNWLYKVNYCRGGYYGVGASSGGIWGAIQIQNRITGQKYNFEADACYP